MTKLGPTMSRNEVATPQDKILIETRVVAGVVIAILLVATIILYVFPDSTTDHFAWTIASRLTAMLIGAGYATGIYFFGCVLLGDRWHRVALGYLPIAAFTMFMLIATLLHFDRFHREGAAFWAWLIVYIVTPVLVPLVWWRQRREFSWAMDDDDLKTALSTRRLLLLIGAISLAISLFFFVVPSVLIALAPWKLTPLTARVAAGWCALGACTAVSVASDPRRSSANVLVQCGLIGMALSLLAAARASDELVASDPATWIFVAFLALLALLFGGLEFARFRRRGARV
jgi:hypothetical protein